MIYEETYQFLLRNVSSKEFDACLCSLLNTDWDGIVQLPSEQIAKEIGTTKKYMNYILKKFSSRNRRNIFVPTLTGDGLRYRFNLGPTRSLKFNKVTDRYCKKYEFFYTKAFRSLPINAKRLLLMGAFRMSVTKNEIVIFDYNEIVPSTYKEGISLFTKSRLLEAIEAIQVSNLGHIVSVGLASSTYTRKQVVMFAFNKGTLNNYVENHTERLLLRKKVFEAGFPGFLNDEVCIEIEKVGKYLYNSLLNINKEHKSNLDNLQDIKDELTKMARFIYNASIKKFANALHTNKHFLDSPKQAAAYFSTIVYDGIMNEMAVYGHQAECIKSLIENEYLHKNISSQALNREVGFIEVNEHIKPILLKHKKAEHIYNVLSDWCESWVISRVKSVSDEVEKIRSSATSTESNQIEVEKYLDATKSAVEYVSTLKKSTYEQINKITLCVQSFGSKAVSKDLRTKFLEDKKESFSSYFAIQLDRFKNLTTSFS